MDTSSKKKKFVSVLKLLSEKRQRKADKNLSEHHFHIKAAQEQAGLFDKLVFRAIMEQAEGLSLTFNKPYHYQAENEALVRLGKEAYEVMDKSAILRPTRLGPLTLIS